MAYRPQPGTIAYRAIEWLKTQPNGTQVTASVWAEAIDSEATTLVGCLATAVSSGLVVRHKRPDNVRLVWWSLADGEPVPPAPKPTAAPATSTPTHGGRPTTLRECAEAEEKPAKPASFDVWFSGVSGELVIQGAHVDRDGDVVLPKEQVRQLLAALSGVAA